MSGEGAAGWAAGPGRSGAGAGVRSRGAGPGPRGVPGERRGPSGTERVRQGRQRGPGRGSGSGARPARRRRRGDPRNTRASRGWSRRVTGSVPGASGARPRGFGAAGGGPKPSPGGSGRPRAPLHGGAGAGKVLCAVPAVGGMGSAGKAGGIALPSSVSRCGSITGYRAQQKEITVCWPRLSAHFSHLVAVIRFLFENTNLSVLGLLLGSFRLCRCGFGEFSLSCWLKGGRLALVVGHWRAGFCAAAGFKQFPDLQSSCQRVFGALGAVQRSGCPWKKGRLMLGLPR